MPSGMLASDLVDGAIADDMTKNSPHRQDQNRPSMEAKLKIFKTRMLSANEERHKLLKSSGELDDPKVYQYLERDQYIRGLLSAYIATSSGVPMRAFQFASIAYDSGQGFDRNMWALRNRFHLGKPIAKQRHLDFADVLFSIVEELTGDLSVLLFYEQPFICSLLDDLGFKGEEHKYATHVWPLIPKKASLNAVKVWSGQQISRSLRSISHEIIGCALDPALVRQMAEGLLREKIPSLFEVFHSRDNFHLEKGSYRFSDCLQSYANNKGLQALANVAGISLQRTAACLIIVEIWQCIHKIQIPNPIWQPMVGPSFLFQTTAHLHLAHMTAKNITQTISIIYRRNIDQDALTRGLKSLENTNYPELIVSCPAFDIQITAHWAH